MPFFLGVKGDVYYRAWRAEDPVAAVVFLHGFGEHSGLYHRYADALVADGISVWALDQIGHGLSEGERAVVESIQDLVDNAQRLTDLVVAAEPHVAIVLAGHSLGAAAAAVSVIDHADRYVGLVLSGAPVSPVAWVTELAESGANAAMDLDPGSLSADPFYLDELENDPLAFTNASGSRAITSTLPETWRRLEAADAITLPLLLIHGEEDPVVPVEGVRIWAAGQPSATLRVFPHAHHDVLNDVVHADVSRIVAEFVRSLLSDHRARNN